MPARLPALPAHFNVEPELREQLGNHPGVQRCVEGHEELLLIVHDLPGDSISTGSLFFWRRHDGRWTQPGGPGLDDLAGLLNRYTDAISSRKSALGRAATAREIFGIVTATGPLQRSTAELGKALEQARSFDPSDIEIRDLAGQAQALARAAELLQGNALMNLEFLRAEQTGELNATLGRLEIVLKRLAVIVMLFLPLTAILLLLGNAGDMSLPAKIIAWIATCLVIAGAWVLLGLRPRSQGFVPIAKANDQMLSNGPDDSSNSATES